MAKTEGFAEYYLGTIIADTAAGAGTELIRRTVGMAQVKDITTIADRAKRIRAERINITEFGIARAPYTESFAAVQKKLPPS